MTPKQQAVLEFAKKSVTETGLFPSYRQIAMHLGHKSPSAASNAINALCRDGYLQRSEHRSARGMKILFWENGAPNWEGIARALQQENNLMRQTLTAYRLPLPPRSVTWQP